MLDKKIIAYSTGGATGVLLSPVLKTFAPGAIPWISDVIGPVWGSTENFIPIVGGALAFGISQFTKIVKNTYLKAFLTLFGITALTSGLINAVLTPPAAAFRARAAAPRVQAARAWARPVSRGITETGISGITTYA